MRSVCRITSGCSTSESQPALCNIKVWPVKLFLQGQHCRFRRCKEAPERGCGSANVDASIFQRHSTAVEGESEDSQVCLCTSKIETIFDLINVCHRGCSWWDLRAQGKHFWPKRSPPNVEPRSSTSPHQRWHPSTEESLRSWSASFLKWYRNLKLPVRWSVDTNN